MMKEFPTRYRILTYFVACTTATIDERTDMNESRTDKDTAQQNHCHHNGSPAFFDRTPLVHINVYDARYRTYDERRHEEELRNARARLTYPGTRPPGPHKRAQAAAQHSHATSHGVRKVVSRRCILGMHTPVSGGSGFETGLRRGGGRIHTGADKCSPRVIRTGSVNPSLAGSPYTQTSLIPHVDSDLIARETEG